MVSDSSTYSPYSLSAGQLEDAVKVLRTTAESLKASPRQERLYKWLSIAVQVSAVAFVAVIISVALDWHEQVVGAFGLVLFLAVALATLLLAVNAPLILKAFRQRSVLKKLGIREVSRSAWKAGRKRHTFSRVTRALLTVAGTLCLLTASLVVLGRAIQETPADKETDFAVFIVVALFIIVGATILIWQFVQRSREQLAIVADANRLRSLLQSIQSEAGAGGTVEVPAEVLESVARIERVNIERERTKAVVASTRVRSQGYALLVARNVPAQKASIDAAQRVAVEDLIDDLSTDPRPPGSEPIADGLFCVRTPEGDVEVHYGIDDAAQRVQIVAVGRTDSRTQDGRT